MGLHFPEDEPRASTLSYCPTLQEEPERKVKPRKIRNVKYSLKIRKYILDLKLLIDE